MCQIAIAVPLRVFGAAICTFHQTPKKGLQDSHFQMFGAAILSTFSSGFALANKLLPSYEMIDIRNCTLIFCDRPEITEYPVHVLILGNFGNPDTISNGEVYGITGFAKIMGFAKKWFGK